ncbi:hypothetical protein MYB17_004346, partial [Escherichia coli]|nr:hypothetical protein [Escherichia coli]
ENLFSGLTALTAEFTVGEGELMAHDVPLGCAPDEYDDLISGTCSHLPKQINSNPDNTKDGIDGKDILNNGWSCFNVAVYPGSFLNKLNKPLL